MFSQGIFFFIFSKYNTKAKTGTKTTVENFTPIEKSKEAKEKDFFFNRYKYMAKSAKNINGKSLCEDINPSIKIRGLKAKNTVLKIAFLGNKMLDIL